MLNLHTEFTFPVQLVLVLSAAARRHEIPFLYNVLRAAIVLGITAEGGTPAMAAMAAT